MTFLNSILLFGAAAFVVPLVIHLLNRSKYQSIDWGAMIFLEDAVKVNSRRFQWQTWLLLLLRCAIPIVLAVCMARPMLTNYFFTQGIQDSQSDATATVLVIDSSISMQAQSDSIAGSMATSLAGSETKSKSQNSYAAEAIQKATDLITKSGNAVRWGIAVPQPTQNGVDFGLTRDKQKLADRIEQIGAKAGDFSVLEEIDRALNLLSKNPEAAQRIVVVSDFQSSLCSEIDPQAARSLRGKIESLAIRPKLVFMPLGDHTVQSTQSLKQSITPENLSIQIDRNTPSLVGTGQPWELKARVKNHGATNIVGVIIEVRIDGVAITTRKLDLPSEAESQLNVVFEFPKAGPHIVTASVLHSEYVTGDNTAAWSVVAVGAIPTLVVSDDDWRNVSDPNRDWNDADFLMAALGKLPTAGSVDLKRDSTRSLFQVDRKLSSECSVADLDRHRLLVLANASRLSDDCGRDLAEWVWRGGVLMIFPGEKFSADWYNQLHRKPEDLKSDGENPGLLPLVYDMKPQIMEDSQEGETLRRDIVQHPSVQFLNDTRWGSIDSFRVKKWFRLVGKGPGFASRKEVGSLFHYVALESKANDATILSLTNGDPFLAIESVGQGTIVQWATSAGDQWSNWPVRPIYLPMIQQSLIGSIPPGRWKMNVQTGESLTLPTEEMLRWIDGERPQVSKENSSPNTNQSNTRTMRWSTPSAVDQLVDTARSEGATGQPAIIAREPGVYTAIEVSDVEASRREPYGKSPSKSTSKPYGSRHDAYDASGIDGANVSNLYMAAQIPPSESDLRLESLSNLQSLAENLGAKVITSTEEYILLESGSGSEMWRWFLLLLLALLFGEVLLQRHLSIGGSS